MILCELVASTNSNGYSTAILKALADDCGGIKDLPTKGALSQIRKRISALFFRKIFCDLIAEAQPHRETWNGLYVYAVDGLQLTLPKTDDIIAAGYSGRSLATGSPAGLSRLL